MKKIGIILMTLALIGVVSCKGGKKCCKDESAAQCSQQAETEAVQQPKKEKKVIVARVVVKEGQEKAFIDVATVLVNATRQEEGNLFYSLYQSPVKATEFIFYEEYKDDAAFQTHASSAHFAAFAEGTKDLTEGALIVDEF
ncbi:MAG: antibiotic biosynthesis monooxygenase [Tannerella sp.]|jgi:quinol monooxygenase YgiN|nr:antibiotic biosynthesis monooxygenase [Tannerella sp.]